MSTTYSVNAVKIIDSALRVLGVLRSGDTSNSDSALQTDCLEALNLMIKNWQNFGIEMWSRKATTISNLSAYKSNYTIKSSGADVNIAVPERIIQAFVTPQANLDVEVTPISMGDYWGLANKQATGMPNQVAYDFQNTQGVLYVWPVPTVNTYSLTIVYHKPYDDFTNITDAPDVPQRWFEALKWGLVLRLAPEFGRQVSQEMLLLYQKSLENAIEAGYEEGSVFFGPSYRR